MSLFACATLQLQSQHWPIWFCLGLGATIENIQQRWEYIWWHGNSCDDNDHGGGKTSCREHKNPNWFYRRRADIYFMQHWWFWVWIQYSVVEAQQITAWGGGRKFNCTDCSYKVGTLDEMMMHDNMQHNSLSVTVIKAAVDDIIGEGSSLNVKRLKYRLYD